MSQVQRGHIIDFNSQHLQKCSAGEANHVVLSRNSPVEHPEGPHLALWQFWMNLVIILGLPRGPRAPYTRTFFGGLCC